MIKLENYEVVGWEHAIRGMRNPKNSWDRSDSLVGYNLQIPYEQNQPIVAVDRNYLETYIGDNDHELMMRLAKGGPVHAKYRRMITVYVDITAPLYWWKEFDTYKVGTVANSCSTMHKIHDKEFAIEDFSCEKLITRKDPDFEKSPYVINPDDMGCAFIPMDVLDIVVGILNSCREYYLNTGDKKYWNQMIQLLPSSYNQKRTIMMNYEVLAGIYEHRRNHKLDEWHKFCDWIEELPYSEIITGGKGDVQ